MKLALKKEQGRWTGSVSHDGETLQATSTFDAKKTSPEEAQAAFEFAAKLVFDKKKAVLDAAVDGLLDTWNSDWRDGGRELSPAAFRNKLRLTSFTPCELDNPSFLVSVYLDVGDLFPEHSIEVMLEKDGSILGEAELIG